MEQLTIRLQKSDMIKIEKLARDYGLKRSDITRMAIKKFLETTPEPERKPFEKAMHLIGVAQSGVSDLGQNHRQYLIERMKAKGHGK